MTKKQMEKREDVVKSMKDTPAKRKAMKSRYGEDWKSVAYATATKIAKKKVKEGTKPMRFIDFLIEDARLNESKTNKDRKPTPEAPRAKHLADVMKTRKGGGHYSEKMDYKRSKEKQKFRKEMFEMDDLDAYTDRDAEVANLDVINDYDIWLQHAKMIGAKVHYDRAQNACYAYDMDGQELGQFSHDTQEGWLTPEANTQEIDWQEGGEDRMPGGYSSFRDDEEREEWEDYDRSEREDQFRDDVDADADTLRSAGYGTDEDYGRYSDEFEEESMERKMVVKPHHQNWSPKKAKEHYKKLLQKTGSKDFGKYVRRMEPTRKMVDKE